MPLTVVLAVGLDSWLLATHSAVWRSAGYIVLSASNIREAIEHFKAGDFDLVLLGDSISAENKERLTFLIRASGSRTPVVCVASSSMEIASFADATLKNDSSVLLAGMGELLEERAKTRGVPTIQYSNVT
jgi:DNA-binding response OmpR family regulator